MIDNVSHDNALLLEAAQKYQIHSLGEIRVTQSNKDKKMTCFNSNDNIQREDDGLQLPCTL